MSEDGATGRIEKQICELRNVFVTKSQRKAFWDTSAYMTVVRGSERTDLSYRWLHGLAPAGRSGTHVRYLPQGPVWVQITRVPGIIAIPFGEFCGRL
jgi:hypothetical protein